jgi:hypothetical protein
LNGNRYDSTVTSTSRQLGSLKTDRRKLIAEN